MVNIYNEKNNALYYIAGSLAILTLLASGVFAAAPYAQFLAPVAALGLGTPLIAVCAAFSVIAFAFSAIAISKNKTISEREAQLASTTQDLANQNKIISGKEAQLTEKAKEVKDKDVVISYVDEQLAKKDVVISEMKDQLAKKAAQLAGRDVQLADKTEALSRKDAQLAKQTNRKNRVISEMKDQLEKIEDDKFAESLFENISAESGWSTKQVLGVGVGAVAVAGLASYASSLLNHATSLANNPTGVGNFHNDDCLNPSPVFQGPALVQSTLQDKVNGTEDMLKTSQERAKQNFGIKNPKEYDFSAVNGTVERGISTSVYSVVRDRVFGLFTGKGTTSNGTAEKPAPISQNDPTQSCTVINARGHVNQTVLPTPCSLGDYQVPLPGLQGVALCCPSIPKVAHSSSL